MSINVNKKGRIKYKNKERKKRRKGNLENEKKKIKHNKVVVDKLILKIIME